MTVQTAAPQFKADSKLLEYIDNKLGKLSSVFDKIIDCNVTLKLENSGKVKDKIAEVKILVPGGTIIATEKQKTFEAAIDLISDNLRRQLKRHKERLIDRKRGSVN